LRVPTRFLQAYPIPVAPLAEQRRIVAAIEQQFTRLDAAVASLKRAQAALKRYRAAVLKAAVEGELTAEWRAQHPAIEPASVLLQRILQERRAAWVRAELDKYARAGKAPPKGWQDRYQGPVEPETTGLPRLPVGWCWTSVEQTVFRSEYGTSVKCDYQAAGEPVLRIPNIAAGEIDLRDIKFSTVPLRLSENEALQAGDILMCRTNGSVSLIGKAAVVRTELRPLHSFASYLLRFRLMETETLPLWLHLFVTSPQGRAFIESNAASSAGQHNVSLSLIHRMVFPLPSLEEQQQIVAEIDQRLSVVAHLEAQVDASLKRAERLRQRILQQAFAGQLVPQDPSDEPAGVLLERVRAGRAGPPPSRAGRQGRVRPKDQRPAPSVAREAPNPARDAGTLEIEPFATREVRQLRLPILE
jgi:type I restriction enzyme S subunit